MRDALAERLFGEVMGMAPEDEDLLVRTVRPLQRMASYKFDDYGGYGPGIKFLETLAIWLQQFERAEREVALQFVTDELVFLSDREIQHALALAYQDLVRPALVREAAAEVGVGAWCIAQVLGSSAFRIRQRRTMFMGLADGARLDQFRRANPALVHEQFSITAEPPDRVATGLRDDLKKWLEKNQLEGDATFNRFVLIDDFSGSGFTALRQNPKDGTWGGKLHHVRTHLDSLVKLGVATSGFAVQVLLYTASEQAKDALRERIKAAGLSWTVEVVQLIPRQNLVNPDSEFAEICRKYHDTHVDDKVKTDASSATAALGFRDSRLPLILSHNTPNNSVGILWENTADEPNSTSRFTPLFPRHERHKADR
jgi:hypothetical protein